MNTTISDVFSIRRQATIAPQTFEVEDEGEMKTAKTMADSVRPLLTSMKLFGLYFRSRTENGNNITDEKSRRRWNGNMIYGLIVAVLLWIDVVRMFSVFKSMHICVIITFSFSLFQTYICRNFSIPDCCIMHFLYFFPKSSKDDMFNLMFSVFTAHETFGPFLFFKFIAVVQSSNLDFFFGFKTL